LHGVWLAERGGTTLVFAQQGSRVVVAAAPRWRRLLGPAGRLLAAAVTPSRVAVALRTPTGVELRVLSPGLRPLRRLALPGRNVRVALGTLHGRIALVSSALEATGRVLRLTVDGGARWETTVLSRGLPCALPRAVGVLGTQAAVAVGSACDAGVAGTSHLLVQRAGGWHVYDLNDAGANAGAAFVGGTSVRLARSFDRAWGLSLTVSS
jgi:hypothetical protein